MKEEVEIIKIINEEFNKLLQKWCKQDELDVHGDIESLRWDIINKIIKE